MFPWWAAIGGVLKVVGKVAKVAGKVVAVSQAVGGAVNNATTPYFSEAGQRIQAIRQAMPEASPKEDPPTTFENNKVKTTITHDDKGNMVGNISGVEVLGQRSGLPSWLPLALLGLLAVLILSRKS